MDRRVGYNNICSWNIDTPYYIIPNINLCLNKKLWRMLAVTETAEGEY